VNEQAIPRELKRRRQWVVWRFLYGKRDVKPRKVLYTPATGEIASSTDLASWGTYEEARAAFRRGGWEGIGFVFAATDTVAGVDLDDCVDVETGGLTPQAQAIVNTFHSYTEYSPSGRGIHILVFAAMPDGRGRKQGNFEAYSSGRFFTITGNHLKNTPLTIEGRQTELDDFLAAYLPAREKSKGEDRRPPIGNTFDDAALLEKMRSAKNGAKIDALLYGDTGGYTSQSDADLALCSHLMWWTNGDSARMDRIFRQSGLMREKWDERRGQQTYGERTIAYVLEDFTGGYTGESRNRPLNNGQDTAEKGAPSGEYAEQAPRAEPDDALPYEATLQGLVWKKPTSTRDGQVSQVTIPLANFTAQIVADITEDDGAETRRQFEIEAKLRGRTFRFTVPAERFAAMGWPTEHLGATAILYPGQSIKEHARTAIQLLSRDIPERRTYTHTGWVTLDSGPVYLHAGGAISADGARTDISVALQGDLRGYELPIPSAGDVLRAAVRAELRMLELAPDTITFSLHAAIYLAPIADADTSVYLAGQTGAGKSELAALAQQHYGAAMDSRHLPASWASSGNALEAQAFLAKDALLVIDDFVPAGSTADIQRQHRDADRVLRAQGNHSGRQRMRADTSLRPAKPPRGVILSTGEDIPRGHSLRGRMFILEVAPEALRWEQLAACQDDARNGLYAQVMAGYLQWLAGQLAERRESQRAILAKYRADAFASNAHRRTPEIVAKLAYGLHTFLEFAESVGAISQQEQAQLWQRGWKAIGAAAAQQAQHQNASEPTRRFLELVNAALTAHTAHLATTSGEKPGTYEQSWGWQKITVGSGEREEWREQGARIGWLDDNDVYLEPTATYTLVQKMASASSDPLGVTLQVLQKRLKERGLLASTDKTRNVNTIRRRCEGRQINVLHFTLDTLSHYTPPDKPDTETKNTGEEAGTPLNMSGFDVRKSATAGNPTSTLTSTTADNSGIDTSNVGFVGSDVVREHDGITERDHALADVIAMSGNDSLSVQNPTSKPDIPARSSRRITFEERVQAYMHAGMREDDAIQRVLAEKGVA
jgi:hypothetical protein